MREIKFRGKTRLSIEELNDREVDHKDGWIIGNLIVNGDKPMIVGDLIEVDPEYIVHEQWCSVRPETIGQYTGLKDKNGKPLYEHDITKDKYGNISVCCWIKEVAAFAFVPSFLYPNKEWHAIFEEQGEDTFFRNDKPAIYHEIIGNIHEDAHLLSDAK